MQYHLENVWVKSPKEVAKELAVDLTVGLSSNESDSRLKKYGLNTFGDKSSRSPIWLFLAQFSSPLIIILLIAAIVTFSFHEIVDALVILLAVFSSVGLGFYQEYKAERATQALRSYIEERVRVIRDGRETEIDAKLIIPGDIVLLRAGERVPADARVFEIYDLSVDESILTGESLPVDKVVDITPEHTPLPERINMVFGGTYVAEGQGRAIVIATADGTEFGKIATAVFEQKRERTPLQKSIQGLAWLITVVVVVLVSGIYFLGIARGMEHLDIFLVAIAIAVGAIPEALPPGLTAILAVGVERIAKQKGIVRSLLAAETLGSTTVVITDKTGTLTTGSLELVSVDSLDGLLKNNKTSDTAMKQILRDAVINVNVIINNPEDKPSKWQITGRHLDVAIAKASAVQGIPVGKILKTAKPVKLFNSSHKYSIYKIDEETTILGAPDILLKHTDLSSTDYARMLEILDERSRQGKRLLAVGEVLSSEGENLKIKFIGIISFYDPLRPGIKEAIIDIENSGVRVLMATGDLPGTALAIAEELGWRNGETHILTGENMRTMTDEELTDALSRVRVFARMTPEDKYRIVELLSTQGEVVAMLGDGVNDAPSLKRAAVGIAVGSGTDVAKGVADMVLLEDDFHVIKSAINEGKLILVNIRKTFVYLMSNSLDEIFLLGGALIFGLALPLSPLQVIWVNFFTGSIPAIAYAFDRERPRSRINEKSVLSREVIWMAFGIGTISSMALFGLYYFLVTFVGSTMLERTFLFACFASYTLVIAFSFRNLQKPLFTYPVFENRVLNLGILIGITFLLLTIYLPQFQNIFSTVALPLSWLLWVLVWCTANIILVEGAKYALARSLKN